MAGVECSASWKEKQDGQKKSWQMSHVSVWDSHIPLPQSEHWFARFLNCGLPRLSREQISPSMTALAFGKESEIDSASAEKEANGFG